MSVSRSMSRSRDREHPLSAEGLPASLGILERCGPSRPPSKRNAGQKNQRDFYDYRFAGLDIEVPSLRRGDTLIWASGVKVSPPRRRKGSTFEVARWGPAARRCATSWWMGPRRPLL